MASARASADRRGFCSSSTPRAVLLAAAVLLLAVGSTVHAAGPWDPAIPATAPAADTQPTIVSNNGTVSITANDLLFLLNNGANTVNASVQELVTTLAALSSFTMTSIGSAATASNTALLSTAAGLSTAAYNQGQSLAASLNSVAVATSAQTQAASADAASSLSAASATLWTAIGSTAVSVSALAGDLAAGVVALSQGIAARVANSASLAASISSTYAWAQDQVAQLGGSAAQASGSIAAITTSMSTTATVLTTLSRAVVASNLSAAALSSSLTSVQSQTQAQLNQLGASAAIAASAISQAASTIAVLTSNVTAFAGVHVSFSGAIAAGASTTAALSSSVAQSQSALQAQIVQTGSSAQFTAATLSAATAQSLLTLNANVSRINGAIMSGAAVTSQMESQISSILATTYTITSINALHSNIVSTLSSSIASQISQVTATTLVLTSTASLLTTFKTGLFTMNTAAPLPTAAGMPSGCTMWLDAMNSNSAIQDALLTWNEISTPTAPRAFFWTGVNAGLPVRINGAYHFNGNGYFTNAACTFLTTGTAARTFIVWARPTPGNVYIRHVFHYGNTVFGNAYGITHWVPAPAASTPIDQSTSGIGTHQWAFQTVAPGTWNFGELAMFTVVLTGGQYQYSKNGGPLVAFPAPNPPTGTPNTVLNNAGGFCNVGARISGGEMFSGSISAVYSYSRALTDAEISYVYTATNRAF